MLERTSRGLYCAAGDFYVDPWEPVERAIVTHAHADHARRGSHRYLAAQGGERLLRRRLDPDARIETVAYGEAVTIGGVRVSLHPAGHVLGSAQVRLERGGEVWVVSGDYKTEPDPTCAAFEPLACHTFVTESTFGLPIFRWPPQAEVFAEINAWWRECRSAGRVAVLLAYALGKAQRLLAGVDASIGPILLHGAVDKLTADYRASGVALPATRYAGDARPEDLAGALVVAPPSAAASPWMRRFGDTATAFASGWMRLRRARRGRAVERGFVLSDHVDWPALVAAIAATGAERVLVTHGYTAALVRWLREAGRDAEAIDTRFTGEQDDEATADDPVAAED